MSAPPAAPHRAGVLRAGWVLAWTSSLSLGLAGVVVTPSVRSAPTVAASASAPPASSASPASPANSASSAAASTDPDDPANALKKKGDQAMMELRYEDALSHYAQAFALRPLPALHYNRARALEALARYAEALDAYEAFIREAPPELQAKVPGLAGHVAGVRARTSEVQIRVKTAGARVGLRGVTLGMGPLDRTLRVNAGKAQIEVVGEGFLPYDRTLELPGGGKVLVEIELVARDVAGVLSIQVEPAATVTLDGKVLGVSPVESSVAPGTHTIVLTKQGYVSRTTNVVVTANEKKRVELGMEREAGLLSRWWFWTGAGVVVVGASVLTWRALTPKDPASGDIDPGRITSPLLRF